MARDLYDFQDLFPAMERGSDLELVVTGAVVIEDALRWALANAFDHTDEVDLFGDFRPLGPLGAKIDVAFALDLIDPDLWSDLRQFNRMRNDAAHLKRGSQFSLEGASFADRIASFNEIEELRKDPRLTQEDRPPDQRTGILYEGPRSQLHWSLTEWLIKLRKVARRGRSISQIPSTKWGSELWQDYSWTTMSEICEGEKLLLAPSSRYLEVLSTTC